MARSALAQARDRIGPFVAARQPRRRDLPLSMWDLAVNDAGHLSLRGTDLVVLAREHGTPLHVVDLNRLDAVAVEAVAPFVAGEGADIFYSYKTNPVPGVLDRLHRHGIGAEVISEYELWLALRLGVDPDRIVYNGPAKSDESLRLAIQRRIRLLNANSATEVARIARIAAEERVEANVGVRLALASTWTGQFGIPAGSAAIVDAVRAAEDAPFVRLIGLHVHRGGTVRTEAEWRGHVAAVLQAGDELRDSTGWSPLVIDVGGSLSCPTEAAIPKRQFRLNRALGTDLLPPDPADAVSVGQASVITASMVREHFAALGLAVPAVIQEPGRALSAGAQLLLTSVIDVKDDVDPVHAVLDAGSNLADPLPHEYHQLFSASRPADAPVRSYRLAGPICTPADVIYNNWRLPELAPDHVLAIMDTGAYFVPFSRSFSFPQPAIVGLDDDGLHELRRRETFDDVVRRDEARLSPLLTPPGQRTTW